MNRAYYIYQKNSKVNYKKEKKLVVVVHFEAAKTKTSFSLVFHPLHYIYIYSTLLGCTYTHDLLDYNLYISYHIIYKD